MDSDAALSTGPIPTPAHTPGASTPPPGAAPGARAVASARHGGIGPLGALPPAGESADLRGLWSALREPEPGAAAARALAAQLGVPALELTASGREALRRALAGAAARSGRREVALPAYTCFSVPAAAVAAGLRVHLVDVTAAGQLDPADLERVPLERCAALVACNLFGIAEPLAPLRGRARAAGALLIDDAAQAFGAADAEGRAGARGEPAVLSFGRGKPLSALGGGALCWPPELGPAPEPAPLPASGAAGRLGALARLAAYEVALSRWVFPVLAALPALHVGETPFEPDFAHAPLGAAGAVLLLGALARADAAAERRAQRALELAARLRAHAGWQPLLGAPGSRGVFPRLAVLAPGAAARERALARLAELGAGASALYPAALCDLPALAPHLAAAPRALPGARELAARLLTLPTHGRLRGARLEAALGALAAETQRALPGTRS